jgi:type 1 fimbria pilin
LIPHRKSVRKTQINHCSTGTISALALQQISVTFGSNKRQQFRHIRGQEFMRFDRIALICATAALASALSAPAFAQTPYDGNWQVTIVTKTGSCEPTASSMLTVADGKISAPGANVSGTIGREGLVKVSINGAYANGQLSGNAGSGKWNGASAGIPCSGRWEASRQ